jgi:release factor glutamine methyltransferase
LQCNRVELYTNYYQKITSAQFSAFQELIQRRINREPTSYITGHKEFFGLDFIVNSSVLIPRPETETLVEMAIEFSNYFLTTSCLIADIGTGCGAIAVSLAKNLHQSKIYAIDISNDALEIADANCRNYGVQDRVALLRGDLLEPLPEPVNIIVANLPYVRKNMMKELGSEIREFEPSLALNGGDDGLSVLERLLSQVGSNLIDGGAVFAEIGYDQGKLVYEIARVHFHNAEISIVKDLGGQDRVLQVITNK